MRKIFFLTLFFLTFSIGFSQAEVDSLIWQESFTTAKDIAKKEQKKVMIFFTGSDWCGPCKLLVADFFETEKFKKIATENLVLYEADFPRNLDLITKEQRKYNHRLREIYNVSSFPTVIILNEKGRKLGERKGYNMMRDPNYYFQFLEKNI